MVSGVGQHDKAFRATITNEYELLTTELRDGSPASNVHKALWLVLSNLKTGLKKDSLYHAHHQVAQGIRVVLKDWQEYKVGLGEQYLRGEVLDSFTLGYSTMHKIGEDRNKPDSLRYKIAHCFTAEMKVHSQQKEFTQEKLQSIIDGATKAYLEIVQDAELEYGDQTAAGLERDPTPSMATFTAVPPKPPKSPKSALAGTKRKAPASNADDDEQQDGQEDKKPAKKPRKQARNTTADNPQNSPGAVNPAPSFPATEQRRSGNWAHGKPSMWSDDEDTWARGLLETKPQLTFQQLADSHNQRWKDTAWTNAKNVTVTRGERTKGAMQERFKKFRQELRAKAAANAGPSTTTAAKPAAEEEGAEDTTQADSYWLADPARKQDDGEDDEGEEASGERADEGSLAEDENEDEDEDEDPLGDLERAVGAGESFETDGDE